MKKTMKKNKYIIVIALLLISLLLANLSFRQVSNEEIVISKIIPYTIDGWTGKDLKADKATLGWFDEGEFLFRMYEKDNKKLSLAIIFTNKVSHIHDPQICYRGQGINMQKQSLLALEAESKVNYILGKKTDGSKYDIFYWYSDLKRVYSSRKEFITNISISKFLDKNSAYFALIAIVSEKDEKDGNIEAKKRLANKINEILSKQIQK